MPHAFCTSVSERINATAGRLLTCIDAVGEERLWTDFAPNLSSPGNLVLHLIGNLSQYVLKALGGNHYLRQRAKEFSDKPPQDRDALKAVQRRTVNECVAIIDGLGEEELARRYLVQGQERTGFDILLLATEHLSYHTGQFAWFCKYLFRADIDFYKGRDLNIQ